MFGGNLVPVLLKTRLINSVETRMSIRTCGRSSAFPSPGITPICAFLMASQRMRLALRYLGVSMFPTPA